MDLAEGWKSLWSISSIFGAPLLYTGPIARFLGPLFFHPTPNRNLLLSSPSLCPQTPLPPDPFSLRHSVHAFYQSSKLNFVPSSILNSIVLDAISPLPHHSSSDNPILHNTLHILRRSTSDLILFFLTGDNADQIGYVIFSSSNQKILINKDGNIFKQQHGLHHRILKFSVIGAIASNSSSLGFSSSNNSITEGLLLACTLYSVHWFSVEARVSGSGVLDMPVLVHLAFAQFGNEVLHACWSPHLQGESAILLENGELRLADLDSCFEAMKLPMKLRGTRVMVLPNDLSCDGGGLILDKRGWLSCEFGWHPRVLIACCSTAAFLIDLRYEENVTTLAKIEMCDSFRLHSLQTDRFIAFCRASFDDFFFSVASEHHLLLFDVRQPLTPILQWDHGLDSPHYIHMFRLSELRPSTEDGDFKWASDSGFAILLGSFWNGQFSIFCYGPSLQVANKSIAPKISKLCNSLCAWDLPSGLSLLGCECRCGNCLLREEFSKATLPVGIDWHWVKEMVLGFCIVSEELAAKNSENNLDTAAETNGLGGFTLIRLMSSGKLETQRYQASWDFVNAKCNKESSLYLEDTLLCSWGEEDKVYAPYIIQNFDYLFGQLSGNLLNSLASKIQMFHQDCAKSKCNMDTMNTVHCTQDSMEVINNILKAAGIDQIGSPPTISNVLNGIDFPTSIYEIACRRIWGSLSLELLQLSIFLYCDIFGGQRNMHLEFLDIPTFPNVQLPPFFLRKPSRPSRRGWKGLGRVSQGSGLVGPVLPIQVLLTLQQLGGSGSSFESKKEVEGFSSEAELTYQCNEINKVVNSLSKDEPEFISLSDDNDKWVASEEMQDKDPFLLYEPQAFFNNTSLYCETDTDDGCPVKQKTDIDQGLTSHGTSEVMCSGKEFTTFIARKQTVVTLDAGIEQVGLEMFDDLSPINLKFDLPAMNFEPEELNIYKCLKREFSRWEASFKPFQHFCTSSAIPKGS